MSFATPLLSLFPLPDSETRAIAGLLVGILALAAAPAAAQNTFTVDATGDAGDATPGDGTCATASGDCTLRAAIEEANNTANSGGPDEIAFDLSGGGPHTIQPSSALPIITDPVVIDGTSEPDHPNTSAIDAPVVEVDGINAPPGINNSEAIGFRVEASDVTIKGLAITNFDNNGIQLRQGATNALVGENYIGVSPNGSAAGNTINGIEVRVPGSRIGDDGANGTDGNVISSNGLDGISILYSNPPSQSPTTTIVGNRIGTSPDGMSAMGNGSGGGSSGADSGGLDVSAPSVTIGGPSADDRNVISGNDGEGIQTPEDPITITNNYIGVAADGATGLGNADAGVYVGSGSSSNTIGPDNVISGNEDVGIRITDPNDNGTTGNVVEGNFIGTNASGTAAVANIGGGVVIVEGASNNTIGGTTDAARNVISGNSQDGVTLTTGATNNVVQGNYIGTNASGTAAVPNAVGISIVSGGASGNTIGGTASGAGNVVSGNDNNGVSVLNSGGPNTVQGNQIGVAPNGNALGNGSAGIGLSNSGDVTVGGVASGAGNTIAHNFQGVRIWNATGATANTVRGNAIFANTELGIDLANDGRTPNDDAPAGSEDDDDGVNRLQNFPVIQNTSYDAGANEVTLTYEVPSQPGLSGSGASTYPIEVDVYRADADAKEGEAYLHTDTYTASNFNNGPTKTITFTPDVSVTTSDRLVITATDANGNTSEFGDASSPLPVNLASFEGTQTGSNAVSLRWTTASEQNNAGFRVQHKASEDDRWQKLGFVESKADGGTTANARTYRFSTDALAAGTHQFRLKQMDLNGTPHTHKAIPVEVRMTQALRLAPPAPNPVRQRATVSFAVREKTETTMRLYNTLGQRVATVYRGTPPAGEQQTARLSASDLASGVYFLHLRAGDRTETQRITVVH